jgi:hypothetical protein
MGDNVMTAKFTPGPWKAVRNSSYWEIEPANSGQDGVPFNVGDVCSSSPGNPDSGLQEANARLIAAAPIGYDLATEVLRLVEVGVTVPESVYKIAIEFFEKVNKP